MSYKWSLEEDLTHNVTPSYFALPVAEPKYGTTGSVSVDMSQYDVSETPAPTAVDSRDDDIELTIDISPPSGGFQDDGIIPDPAYRLHAIAPGILRFAPDDGTMGDRLVLEFFTFKDWKLLDKNKNIEFPAWWERWSEVGMIPEKVIYENVDIQATRDLLAATDAPATMTTYGDIDPPYGLIYPYGVTDGSKQSFIQRFCNQSTTSGDGVIAANGAVIGAAAPAPHAPNSNTRVLKLHARYTNSGGDGVNQTVMSPRELFHLLFGTESNQAKTHPLLQRIHEIGTQSSVEPRTHTMRLRPPLRTWARVAWEAEQEIRQTWSGGIQPWGLANELEADRLAHPKAQYSSKLKNRWKCNVFVGDICFRAGFRVLVWRLANGTYHYRKANQFASAVERHGDVIGTPTTPALLKHNGIPWARRWDKHLMTDPDDATKPRHVSEVGDRINEMMEGEGRCFVILRQDFVDPPPTSGFMQDSGHIMIVHSIAHNFGTHPPKWETDGDHTGLAYIRADVYEASKDQSKLDKKQEEKPLPNDHPNEDNDIFLVELHPGGDPDVRAGVDDLTLT